MMTKQEKQRQLKIKQQLLELDVSHLESLIRSEKERLETMKNDPTFGNDWSTSCSLLRTQRELKTSEKQLVRAQNKLNKFLKETI